MTSVTGSMLSPIYEHEVMYEISPLLENLSDTLGNFLIRKNGALYITLNKCENLNKSSA